MSTPQFWSDGTPVPVEPDNIPASWVVAECFHPYVEFEAPDPEVNIQGGVWCTGCDKDVTSWWEAQQDRLDVDVLPWREAAGQDALAADVPNG